MSFAQLFISTSLTILFFLWPVGLSAIDASTATKSCRVQCDGASIFESMNSLCYCESGKTRLAGQAPRWMHWQAVFEDNPYFKVEND